MGGQLGGPAAEDPLRRAVEEMLEAKEKRLAEGQREIERVARRSRVAHIVTFVFLLLSAAWSMYGFYRTENVVYLTLASVQYSGMGVLVGYWMGRGRIG